MTLPRCPVKDKVSYWSDKKAWLYAYYIYKRYSWDQSVYYCGHCGYYHLTHIKKRIPNWLIDYIKNETVSPPSKICR